MTAGHPKKGKWNEKNEIAISMTIIAIVAAIGIYAAVSMNFASPTGNADIQEAPEKPVRIISAGWDGYSSLKELAEGSTHIVTGKIIGIDHTEERYSLIITYYNFNVDKSIKGDLKPGDMIIITQGGGATLTEIVAVEDDPLIKVGEEFVGFLIYSPDLDVYPIAGGPQGRFLIQNNLVNSLDTMDEKTAWISVKVHNNNLDQFIQEVQAISVLDEENSPIIRMSIDSVAAKTIHGQTIGTIVPNMQFKKDVSVILAAKFSNPSNEATIDDFILTIVVRDENDNPEEDRVETHKGSAPEAGSVELGLLWNPHKVGKYSILIFSMVEADLTSTIPVVPTIIPVEVVE